MSRCKNCGNEKTKTKWYHGKPFLTCVMCGWQWAIKGGK